MKKISNCCETGREGLDYMPPNEHVKTGDWVLHNVEDGFYTVDYCPWCGTRCGTVIATEE